MINHISFTVEEIGAFSLNKKIAYFRPTNARHWQSNIDEIVNMGSAGFRKHFIDSTGIRISDQEAVEIWQNLIMFHGFIKE